MHAAGQDTEIALASMGLVAALCDWRSRKLLRVLWPFRYRNCGGEAVVIRYLGRGHVTIRISPSCEPYQNSTRILFGSVLRS